MTSELQNVAKHSFRLSLNVKIILHNISIKIFIPRNHSVDDCKTTLMRRQKKTDSE